MKTFRSYELPGCMPSEEIRRILNKYRRSRARYRPKPGQESKSRVFSLWDIAMLADLEYKRTEIYRFIRRDSKYGFWGGISKPGVKRINDILVLLENNMITKSQYGVYHFHDKPQRPPVREMRVNLFGRNGVQLLRGVKQAVEPKRTDMPKFDSIFGSK